MRDTALTAAAQYASSLIRAGKGDGITEQYVVSLARQFESYLAGSDAPSASVPPSSPAPAPQGTAMPDAGSAAGEGSVEPGALPSACTACGGPIWDNRKDKKNPKAPDWKCRDKSCTNDKGYVTGGWAE